MIDDVAKAADPSVWPTIGLMVFVGLFVAAAIWVYRPGRKRELEQYRDLPMQDDQPRETRGDPTEEERP